MGGESDLVSLKGTWCTSHCLKKDSDDLREVSPVAEKGVKMVMANRSYITQTPTRISKLKIICHNLGIVYTTIPEDFKDRSHAWLGIAIEK